MAVRSNASSPEGNPETPRRVASVRGQCGYAATKYDANPVSPPKTLRRHFSRSYDDKKIRNSHLPDRTIHVRFQRSRPTERLVVYYKGERLGEARLLDPVANDRKPLPNAECGTRNVESPSAQSSIVNPKS